ncbi:hypothetical protein SPRG_16980 [Saprolegnia parasitica CBS 223.65]|uniref:Uncharacterized protein n=1 Tax=Saprolegnia parasitica (strain CBS 223.65) TaxID=695850 RepID=A0A067BSF3_SAPPC|nr:hypothetical protein SPRG_16980 [Saprolegnia parasitica CBS 223.65]KDO17602.1 hypothetical protein SPRG_16980 [Saprolegnia parasitica CBS 223.65]|eukprot:XP_012211690.1 hypothetical protein SPRG_16980 [Saprolegnia parasitica CBS 223.65]
MARVVLTSPPLVGVIFGYQFGVYEDVRYWFLMTASLQISPEDEYDMRGDKTATRRILACRPDLASAEAVVLASHCARFELLHRDGYVCSSNAIRAAIGRGHLDGIRFLFEHGVAPPRNSIERAVGDNQRDILAYLLTLADADVDVDAALATALHHILLCGSNVAIVDMLLASGRTSVPPGAVLAALQKRHLNLARCLLSHGGLLDVASVDAKFFGLFANDIAPLLDLLREFGIDLPTSAKSPCAVSDSSR